jgi:hypothetical protein
MSGVKSRQLRVLTRTQSSCTLPFIAKKLQLIPNQCRTSVARVA